MASYPFWFHCHYIFFI